MLVVIADKISVVMLRIKEHGVNLLSIDPKFNYMCAQKDGGCVKRTRVIRGKKTLQNHRCAEEMNQQRCHDWNRDVGSATPSSYPCADPLTQMWTLTLNAVDLPQGRTVEPEDAHQALQLGRSFVRFFSPQLVYFTPFEWRVACQRRHKCKRWVL